MVKHIKGNLIQLARGGFFDIIAHGCNCQNNMGAGIAPQMARAFGADKFPMESPEYKGKMSKLGKIDAQVVTQGVFKDSEGLWQAEILPKELIVVNAYTQYNGGPNAEYSALMQCMDEISKLAVSLLAKRYLTLDPKDYAPIGIGLPLVGCGIGGLKLEKLIQIVDAMFGDSPSINCTLVYFDREPPTA